jgi:glycosyltransferase involved in cell wall biosynthesis
MESMSSGVVVLTTPVGVVPEIVRDGETGFLLPFENLEEAFVRAIRATARDFKARRLMGDRARVAVRERFDVRVAAAASRYDQLYAAAVVNRRRRPVSIEFRKQANAVRASVMGTVRRWAGENR